MTNILKQIGATLVFLAFLDILILFTAIGQATFEGRTGYWSPWWQVQAEQVMRFLQ